MERTIDVTLRTIDEVIPEYEAQLASQKAFLAELDLVFIEPVEES